MQILALIVPTCSRLLRGTGRYASALSLLLDNVEGTENPGGTLPFCEAANRSWTPPGDRRISCWKNGVSHGQILRESSAYKTSKWLPNIIRIY